MDYPDLGIPGALMVSYQGPKRCNCKKARCLKLYCVCFAAGVYCNSCACRECQNSLDCQDIVMFERQKILQRSPRAFAPKVEHKMGGELAVHKKGCRCRKSKCLKKYCECFDAGVFCCASCRCEECHNLPEGGMGAPAGIIPHVGLPAVGLPHHSALPLSPMCAEERELAAFTNGDLAAGLPQLPPLAMASSMTAAHHDLAAAFGGHHLPGLPHGTLFGGVHGLHMGHPGSQPGSARWLAAGEALPQELDGPHDSLGEDGEAAVAALQAEVLGQVAKEILEVPSPSLLSELALKQKQMEVDEEQDQPMHQQQQQHEAGPAPAAAGAAAPPLGRNGSCGATAIAGAIAAGPAVLAGGGSSSRPASEPGAGPAMALPVPAPPAAGSAAQLPGAQGLASCSAFQAQSGSAGDAGPASGGPSGGAAVAGTATGSLQQPTRSASANVLSFLGPNGPPSTGIGGDASAVVVALDTSGGAKALMTAGDAVAAISTAAPAPATLAEGTGSGSLDPGQGSSLAVAPITTTTAAPAPAPKPGALQAGSTLLLQPGTTQIISRANSANALLPPVPAQQQPQQPQHQQQQQQAALTLVGFPSARAGSLPPSQPGSARAPPTTAGLPLSVASGALQIAPLQLPAVPLAELMQPDVLLSDPENARQLAMSLGFDSNHQMAAHKAARFLKTLIQVARDGTAAGSGAAVGGAGWKQLELLQSEPMSASGPGPAQPDPFRSSSHHQHAMYGQGEQQQHHQQQHQQGGQATGQLPPAGGIMLPSMCAARHPPTVAVGAAGAAPSGAQGHGGHGGVRRTASGSMRLLHGGSYRFPASATTAATAGGGMMARHDSAGRADSGGMPAASRASQMKQGGGTGGGSGDEGHEDKGQDDAAGFMFNNDAVSDMGGEAPLALRRGQRIKRPSTMLSDVGSDRESEGTKRMRIPHGPGHSQLPHGLPMPGMSGGMMGHTLGGGGGGKQPKHTRSWQSDGAESDGGLRSEISGPQASLGHAAASHQQRMMLPHAVAHALHGAPLHPNAPMHHHHMHMALPHAHGSVSHLSSPVKSLSHAPSLRRANSNHNQQRNGNGSTVSSGWRGDSPRESPRAGAHGGGGGVFGSGVGVGGSGAGSGRSGRGGGHHHVGVVTASDTLNSASEVEALQALFDLRSAGTVC